MVLVCFARARLHDEAPTPILLLLLTAQRRKTGMPWRAVHHAREKCQRAQPRLALQSRRRVVAERERRCRVLRAISKDRKPLHTEQARWLCSELLSLSRARAHTEKGWHGRAPRGKTGVSRIMDVRQERREH